MRLLDPRVEREDSEGLVSCRDDAVAAMMEDRVQGKFRVWG